MMFGLENPLHIAFLLMIVLLVFGAKRLPEMGRSLGSGMRGFKETLSGEVAELHRPRVEEVRAADRHAVVPTEEMHVGADAGPAAAGQVSQVP
jgi:sec-independent protein translocase protein TatA